MEYATGTGGQTFGVWGQSNASNGRGVMGLSTAVGFSGTGVFGQSNGPGIGVRGEALRAGVGVYGRTETHSGVLGLAVGNSTTTGVWGTNTSPAGRGVYGTVVATMGTNYAILGDQSQPPSGYAGYFKAGFT